jgi:signal transduction histidine kinase
LAISEKYQYRYIIADIFEIQAKIYLAEKDYKNAKMKLLKCLELYNLLLVKPSIQYCYKQLSNLDTIEGNYRDAYRHYKMYHLYNDSLIDLENRIKFEKQRVSNKAEIQQLLSDRKNKVLTILIFFLIITAILVLYILRQKQLIRQKLELAETKNKISRDLHDEIGSTLSSISMQTEVLKKRIKNQENIDDLVDLIKVESRKTMSTMNDIVWSLNSDNENISQLINRIRNYCSISLGTAGINYHMDVDMDVAVRNNDLHLFKEVYMISKEFINNSMKYASCKNVYVMLHKKGDLMNLILQDDGVGFEIQNKSYNFGGEGISNMHKRAKSIHATINLHSARNEGTTLHLSWPDR